jgi:hypothetical protein
MLLMLGRSGPVGRVLDDQQPLLAAVLPGQFKQPAAARQRQRQAAGVLEVVAGVDEAQPGQLAACRQVGQRLFQDVDAHAVVVHRDAQYAHTERLRQAQVDEVGRRLADDQVARLAQQFRQQVEQLLRAGGDDHVLRRQRQLVRGIPVQPGRAPHQQLAQSGVALGRAVLERGLRCCFVGQQ